MRRLKCLFYDVTESDVSVWKERRWNWQNRRSARDRSGLRLNGKKSRYDLPLN